MTPQFSPLNNYIDLLLDVICVVDKNGRFVYVSNSCERIFGYTAAELIGQPMIELVHPDDRERTLATANDIMAGEHKYTFENRYLRKNGDVVHIAWSARWSEADQRRIAVARDISEQKRAESLQAALYAISEAAHNAEDLAALFKQIQHSIGTLLHAEQFSIARYDSDTGALSFPYNSESPQTNGDAEPFANEECCREIIHSGTSLRLTGENNSASWLGVPLKTPDGIIGVLSVASTAQQTAFSDRDQELLEFVSTQVAAAIERKQMMERLQYMALYDQLTGLPNRELFHDRLRKALLSARRQQTRLALFYLDLDKFKQINDSYGHHSGDALLQQTAQRLLHCVRESDTVARLSGDEFVILLENIETTANATAIGEKIRQAINQTFDLDGRHIEVLPSIGIALFPQHGDDEQALLRRADEAMYGAKKSGGNRVVMYAGLSDYAGEK